MNQSDITEEKFEAAVRAVSGRGEKVNAHTLRQELGCGSYARLTAMLEASKAKGMRQPAAENDPVPDGLRTACSGLLASVWKAAVKHVTEKLGAALDDCRSNLKDACDREQAVSRDADDWRARYEREAELHASDTRNSQREITELRERLGKAEGGAEAMSRQIADLKEQNQRLTAALGNAAVSGRQETEKGNGRMIAAEIVEDGK